MNRVMVISPHPDDESIGCGGTIRRHVENGDIVHVDLLTSGEKGGHGAEEAQTASRREQEAADAAAILGVEHLEFYRQNDGALQANGRVSSLLAARIGAWKPHIVYAPHGAEQHPDHRAAHGALRRALAETGLESPRVLLYEIWTPLQQLDEIVDITPYLETKLRAIGAYKSQCRVMDFVAAAQGLARYRGEMHSWPGGEYAEVFADVTSAPQE